MKFRQDFVTNSSSSSFIVGFKNEDTVEEELSSALKSKQSKKHFNRLIKDFKSHRITQSKALKTYLEEDIFDVSYEISCKHEREMGYRNFREWLKDFKNKENFQKEVFEEYMKRYETFKSKVEKCGFIAEVEYYDDEDGDLEQDILPSMECTIQRFSHH